jgi:hypothetical protein
MENLTSSYSSHVTQCAKLVQSSLSSSHMTHMSRNKRQSEFEQELRPKEPG